MVGWSNLLSLVADKVFDASAQNNWFLNKQWKSVPGWSYLPNTDWLEGIWGSGSARPAPSCWPADERHDDHNDVDDGDGDDDNADCNHSYILIGVVMGMIAMVTIRRRIWAVIAKSC